MREIKISLETATRWYNGTDAELKELAIQTYPELEVKELPKTWDELEINEGHIAQAMNKRGLFATKKQAEASIAMAQLSQLMAVYNDGWLTNYNDCNFKYIIYYQKEKPIITYVFSSRAFLIFKDRETAELFLENFKDLILTAKPLL